MDSVTIPHSSFQDAVQTANSLKLIVGSDCKLDFSTYNLQVSLDRIDKILIQDSRIRPSDQIARVNFSPRRIDRTILLTNADTYALRAIEDEFQKSDGNWESYRRYAIAITQLRYQAIAPHAKTDLTYGDTLIYGNAQLSGATCLLYPDGIHRTVRTLIHLAAPVSPLEQWDRERYVTAVRIVRYCVIGIDGDLHAPQESGKLDAARLRDLCLQRIKAPDNFINPLQEAFGSTEQRQ